MAQQQVDTILQFAELAHRAKELQREVEFPRRPDHSPAQDLAQHRVGSPGPLPLFGTGQGRSRHDTWFHGSPGPGRAWAPRRHQGIRGRRIIARHPSTERIIKFTKEAAGTRCVAAWRHGGLRIGDEWIRTHLIVSGDRIIRDWRPPAPEELGCDDLEPALAPAPDIVILGTGAALIRPKLDLMALMAERGIGLEVMSTPAACRTYNVLLQEGRAVVAALYIPQGPTR